MKQSLEYGRELNHLDFENHSNNKNKKIPSTYKLKQKQINNNYSRAPVSYNLNSLLIMGNPFSLKLKYFILKGEKKTTKNLLRYGSIS